MLTTWPKAILNQANAFENVLILYKHLDIISHFSLNSTTKELLENNYHRSTTEPVVSLVELENFKEDVADRFNERFKLLILKGVQLRLSLGGWEGVFVDIERNRIELIREAGLSDTAPDQSVSCVETHFGTSLPCAVEGSQDSEPKDTVTVASDEVRETHCIALTPPKTPQAFALQRFSELQQRIEQILGHPPLFLLGWI
ncbi:hypothetical protein HG530_009829 [Fusarium avenaceum]|nr:hypothetical protein HG530_009829 [Fusarium avenaceum]